MVINTRRVLRKEGEVLGLHVESLPSHGPSEVLVKVHAVALNWKDVIYHSPSAVGQHDGPWVGCR